MTFPLLHSRRNISSKVTQQNTPVPSFTLWLPSILQLNLKFCPPHLLNCSENVPPLCPHHHPPTSWINTEIFCFLLIPQKIVSLMTTHCMHAPDVAEKAHPNVRSLSRHKETHTNRKMEMKTERERSHINCFTP